MAYLVLGYRGRLIYSGPSLKIALRAFDRCGKQRNLYKDDLRLAWGASSKERTTPTWQSKRKGRE